MDRVQSLEYTCSMGAQGLSDELIDLRDLVIQRSRLLEISVTLNSTLELDPLLRFIIQSAADLTGSEAASILLVDERTQNLFFAAASGSSPEELQSIPVPLEGSIAGTIFREDRPLIINEVAQDPRHFRQVDEQTSFHTRSLIGVPMRIKDQVTGVLEAMNKRQGLYGESDLRTLEIIASQAAVAINNARLLEALQQAYDELGKLDKMKSDFIAIASHELRTPLGLVLGYASLLQEETRPESAELVGRVVNSALRMRALIDDMASLHMLQLGSSELELQSHELQQIIQQAVDEVRSLVQAKNQTILVELPEPPLVCQVDAAKLTLALANLLNNAVRFTPETGKIKLSLERRGKEALIQVKDNGIGIPSDQLDQIFEAFYQVEDHMTRRHGGLGLGLAIVAAIIEAHQGRVWAESRGEAKGATITLAIPLE